VADGARKSILRLCLFALLTSCSPSLPHTHTTTHTHNRTHALINTLAGYNGYMEDNGYDNIIMKLVL